MCQSFQTKRRGDSSPDVWHRTGALPTLAAGALAAVNDGQNDGLDVSAGAPQAEEAHRVLRVQSVAAAVTERLQIRLLRERRTRYQDRKRAQPTDNNPNRLHATFAKMPMACSLWWSGMVGSFRASRAALALSLSPLGDADVMTKEGEERCEFAVKAGAWRTGFHGNLTEVSSSNTV